MASIKAPRGRKASKAQHQADGERAEGIATNKKNPAVSRELQEAEEKRCLPHFHISTLRARVPVVFCPGVLNTFCRQQSPSHHPNGPGFPLETLLTPQQPRVCRIGPYICRLSLTSTSTEPEIGIVRHVVQRLARLADAAGPLGPWFGRICVIERLLAPNPCPSTTVSLITGPASADIGRFPSHLALTGSKTDEKTHILSVQETPASRPKVAQMRNLSRFQSRRPPLGDSHATTLPRIERPFPSRHFQPSSTPSTTSTQDHWAQTLPCHRSTHGTVGYHVPS
ncbi:hypothetical protein QBC39DRAFT_33714 [Podospora conica]|nr:hypothetical protein QBC39DRAFT_33714 [Schizothecium conicum]